MEVLVPPGPTFTLSAEDLAAGELAALDDNQIFFRLVRSHLQGEGKRLEDLTRGEIKRRFFVDDDTIRRALGPSKLRGRPSRKSASARL